MPNGTEQQGQDVMERMNVSLVGMTVELHRSWKALSALRGISMKDSLIEALKMWCAAQTTPKETAGNVNS